MRSNKNGTEIRHPIKYCQNLCPIYQQEPLKTAGSNYFICVYSNARVLIRFGQKIRRSDNSSSISSSVIKAAILRFHLIFLYQFQKFSIQFVTMPILVSNICPT